MKFAFAGNRDVAVWVLEFIISKGYTPELLMLTEENTDEIKKLVEISGLESSRIFYGKPSSNGVIDELRELNLDYIIGIHYPYIIQNTMLEIPKIGFLNLHPAFLPYNRGWHTPSWPILDGTPSGATLHFMSKELDLGDIIHQKQIDISVTDTANSLYQKLKKLEFDVFIEAFESIIIKSYKRIPQKKEEGTSHKRRELFEENISKIEFDKLYKFEEIYNRLRALTTNDISEACFFVKDGKKYRIQISIKEEETKS